VVVIMWSVLNIVNDKTDAYRAHLLDPHASLS